MMNQLPSTPTGTVTQEVRVRALRGTVNDCRDHKDLYERLGWAGGCIMTARRIEEEVDEEILGAYHFIALYTYTRRKSAFSGDWMILREQLMNALDILAAEKYFDTFEEGKRRLQERGRI